MGFPSPKKPIGLAQFDSCRAAIEILFHEQARHCMPQTWEHVWLTPCKDSFAKPCQELEASLKEGQL